jgi:hypothetical protein
MMSAKPRSIDDLANMGENHEKRIHRLEEKDQSRDDELRGPDGLHTQVAIVQRELAQIIWLCKIVIVVLVGLVVTDFYRTIKTSQHERAQVERLDQQAKKSAATTTRPN